MTAAVLALPDLPPDLMTPVPASLDPVLDAAVACLARHGLRTSLSDIARELGVAPSTVYRKVGSVDRVALLVLTREAQRLLERMPSLVAAAVGPESVTRVMAACISTVREHAVAAKFLRDEGEWLGRLVSRNMDSIIEQGVASVEPFVATAMATGIIKDGDAQGLSQWLVRIMLVTLISPPPGDLEDALNALLLPVLTP